MLTNIVAVLTVGTGVALSLIAQGNEGLTIELDPNVRPEAVHVYSFLKGGFGGYGDFTGRIKASAQEVLVPIYYDFQRATSLKAVVYAKGCELATFVLDPLPLGPSRVQFECRKLGTVWLNGVVTGYPRPPELTVRLQYMASWSHPFFGIFDGAVLSLLIAEVIPDRDGSFAVEVPDFANDGVTKSYKEQAEWSITAWRTGTNDQYWLNSDAQASKFPGALAIQREYPKELQFIAQHF